MKLASGHGACWLVVLLGWTQRAPAADHCAPSAPPAGVASAPEFALRLGIERANYVTERYAGNFAGVSVGASLAAKAWDVALDAPLYHLVKNGLDVFGPGDPFVRGRVRVWQSQRERLAFGVSLGLGVPLGDAEAGLGMGHFMVHPGAWLATSGQAVHTEWSLAYGRVLGAAEHAEPTGPLVNPMNASELSAGGALVWSIFESFDVRAVAMGAVPVAAAGGEARITAGFGARLDLGALNLSTLAAFPLVGDPFEEKLELAIGYSF